MQTYRFRFMNFYLVITSLKKEITDNSLLKLIIVNFNYNALKLFFYIKIFVNKINYSDINISIKKVKTFLCIEILKRR